MSKADERTYRVTGRVVDAATGEGIGGLRVEAWDRDLLVDDLVGSAETGAAGDFHLAFGEGYFRELFLDRSPDLYFKVFSGARLVHSTRDAVIWNVRAGELPVQIAVPRMSVVKVVGGADEDAYLVYGTVSGEGSAGVGGLMVRVFDVGVGEEHELAHAVTDARGGWQAGFLAGAFRQRGKARPDLQARVFRGDALLARSDVRYDAGTRERLDATIPAGAIGMASEHETLTAALAAHYAGPLRALKEGDGRSDVTYLANKSGWDARAVAFAALADGFSAATAGSGAGGVDPAFFYALFRAGVPASEGALYATPPATLRAVWEQAAAQGVIPASLTQSLPAALERFQSAAAARLLGVPAGGGPSSLADLLAASHLDDGQRQTVASLLAAHGDDLGAFWSGVAGALGQDTAQRLRVDGKLAFLTVNNAPLVTALHAAAGDGGVTDPAQLARAGYHRPEAWSRVMQGVPVPASIPGATDEERRTSYAGVMAAQLRLAYPTASVAHLVDSGALAVREPERVAAFLDAAHGEFEIGLEPVDRYLARSGAQADPDVVGEVKRIQRVYQITPGDEAMAGLLRRGVDAAAHVARQDRDGFVRSFAGDLGGEEAAAKVHDRAVQVHNTVLNLVVGYLTAKTGVPLGAAPLSPDGAPGGLLDPRPRGVPVGGGNGDGGGFAPHALSLDVAEGSVVALADVAESSVVALADVAANAGDIPAYATLEDLWGAMDFCDCPDCRSVLSPAAYLVDLLHFVDNPAPPSGSNPQHVLFDRRPDLQHLPLTCENTNTALPYIDVVNEGLEYFVANAVQPLSLTGYQGHDTASDQSADLLATPRHVLDAAYTALAAERFPMPLPFDRELESLRRHFARFGVPLPQAMERLRRDDALEGDNTRYGWRDVLLEEAGITPAEHALLTDSVHAGLADVYGFAGGTSEGDGIDALSGAKAFTRRIGISYEELAALLRTRFINPDADLVPKLERLGVSLSLIAKLVHDNSTATDAEFDAALPTGAGAPDPAAYGGDIKGWLKDTGNFARIGGLIVLADLTGAGGDADFDGVELRHALAGDGSGGAGPRLSAPELLRILRFVRLWRKLGWTMEQTDAALCALWNDDLHAFSAADADTAGKLDTGFLTALPRIGVVLRAMGALELTPARDLLPLLACWTAVGTFGEHALYRQMFLDPTLLARDPVYADDGYGAFLAHGSPKLLEHGESLRAAFALTGEELGQITGALGYDSTTPLTLANLSAVFRRGWLARRLRVSVRELLLLTRLTGLDPFARPDVTAPALLSLAALVQAMRDRSVPTAAALYLVWNQDLSGRAAPDPATVTDLACTLRADFAAVEEQFSAVADPGGDVARSRVALVYGEDTATTFFALLDGTLPLDVPYTHGASTLEPAITAVDAALGYDPLRHRLTHAGLLTPGMVTALQAVAGVTSAFQAAVAALEARGDDAKDAFFTRCRELLPLYQAYVASGDPVETRRAALLAGLKPGLTLRRKRQQALQRIATGAGTDPDLAAALLDAAAAPHPLHAAGDAARPALDDALALETPGLRAAFYDDDTVTGAPAHVVAAAADLEYDAATKPLPANGATPGAAISAVWTGWIEAPDAGFYNLVVEADGSATVTLSLSADGTPITLVRVGNVWRNADPLEWKAGALVPFTVKVEKVKDAVAIRWETPRRPRETVPGRALYPPTVLDPFRLAYVRFLKTASLAAALRLAPEETAYLAVDPDLAVADGSPAAPWPNLLPVDGDPSANLAKGLAAPLGGLLRFAALKAELSPGDTRLLDVLRDPAAAAATADGPLQRVTGWDAPSLVSLLGRFGWSTADLRHLDRFARVRDAFELVRTMGIPAAALLAAGTNRPTVDATAMPPVDTVRDLQNALRARYDAADWRAVIQPLNDEMRALQRDALVAYVLHRMRGDGATEHIDTADKLFEYFLMDVEMQPCMQTSRIRHALSSVQLFVERCVMNLEPRVSPAALPAERWGWMKRYRVWEANRKVFLFPENWLEPELRDDKSPFFREIESELLQSDVTEETATAALLNYLAKLQDVAKLQPCGIHHRPADPVTHAGEVDHVIARAPGAHRRYWYRRYDDGSWLPWEPVKLDIEDNPVTPYVWNGRLLLFWLKILRHGAVDPSAAPAPSNSSGAVTGLSLDALAAGARASAGESTKVTVQAVLCWSEYYNGKWQQPRTSDLDRPVTLGSFSPVGFDRSALSISVTEQAEGLHVWIGGSGAGVFFLYNTHSLPVTGDQIPPIPDFSGDWRWLASGPQSLGFGYERASDEYEFERHVLRPTLSVDVLLPGHLCPDRWEAPFFVHDARHAFFVTSADRTVTVRDHDGVGIGYGGRDGASVVKIPPLVLQTPPQRDNPWGPIGPDPEVVDPGAFAQVARGESTIRQGIESGRTVRYGEASIGVGGAVNVQKQGVKANLVGAPAAAGPL